MYGVGSIAEVLQRIGNGVAASMLHDGFIGVFPNAEMIEIHAGDHFKLRIGRARADGWNIEKARGAALLQRFKTRHGILFKGKILHEVWVKEGFQLHKDDIRRVFPAGRDLPFRIEDGTDLVFGIVLRLADPLRDRARRKAIGKAVIVISVRQIGKL